MSLQLPFLSSVHRQRALLALAQPLGSLDTAHVRGLSTSRCGLSEQQKPEGAQVSASTSSSTQQQQEKQQTSSSSSSDQRQNFYNNFKAGYESKAAGAAGSGSGQEPAAKRLLQTLINNFREVFLPAQDITSATRAYTGPVMDTTYDGPTAHALARQQATGWLKVLDNVQEKPAMAIDWAEELIDAKTAIARLEAERAAGERLDSIDAQLAPLRTTQAAATQALLEQQRQGAAAGGSPGSTGAGDTATAGVAAAGGGAAATAPPTLYKNVTLYTPVPHSDKYLKRNMKVASRSQIASKLETKDIDTVAIVQHAPARQLQLSSCPDARDIEEVDLEDGVQLAALVDAPLSPYDKLSDRLAGVEKMAEDLSGWQHSQITADENEAAEWAVGQLAGDTDPKRFCFKKVSGEVFGVHVDIEIDGMAHSASRVVLVECKPRISMQYVEELGYKKQRLRELVEAGAPNTGGLLDPFSGEVKPLWAVLMAGSWVEHKAEAAACAVRMEELGIEPVLPGVGSHAVGDSCHPWPPHQADRLLAQSYRGPAKQKARTAAEGRGSAADGVAGSTGSGVGAGRPSIAVPSFTPAAL